MWQDNEIWDFIILLFVIDYNVKKPTIMADILDDILDENIVPEEARNYPIADKGLRFANYMVDYICITVLTIIIFIPIVIISGDDSFIDESNSLIEYFIGAIAMTFYYTISEYFFKGKTIGKLVTKTRAVTLENQTMDFSTTLRRSLTRVVPFEGFSFLGNMPTGWHDRWTDTKVIMDADWTEEFKY